jgi:hypothetical protein
MRENESGHRVQHPFVSKIPVGREKAPFLLTLPVDRKPVTTLVFFRPFHHHIKGKPCVPDLAAVTGLFFVKIRVVTDRSLPGDNRHQLRLLCHPNAF